MARWGSGDAAGPEEKRHCQGDEGDEEETQGVYKEEGVVHML